MEPLNQYRQFIQSLLGRYAIESTTEEEAETQLIFDVERDHYQVTHVGWQRDRWVHSCTIHLDIKGGKIWIQWNGTEDDLAQELVNLGVPKTDIVIGFHEPSLRKFTDYAAG